MINFIKHIKVSTQLIKMECKRCGHNFLTKSNLLQHLRRKTPCDEVKGNISIESYLEELLPKPLYNDKTYDCEFCKKKFNHWQNKYRHVKTCPKKNQEPTGTETVTVSKTFLDDLNRRVQQLENQNSKVITINNNIINSGNINSGNTNNITRNFGYENMNAIPHDFVRSCFMNLRFRDLFENLHCDPDYPENHNVRIKNIKRQQIEMYSDDKWKVTSYKNGLQDIMTRLFSIFDEFIRKYKHEALEDMSEAEFQELIKELDEIENLSKKSNEVKNELICAMEENRKLLDQSLTNS